ncbi:hypothetical protein [Halalkalibacter alkalisediminis]|uniref:Uncharacterized protein n=1 Tax=Halalkalibacter alkalisediminis TaxID=935616 RepID=A0ABV6NC67_9BACI|nr:hypothetical protein [Halalkalibacter alkalisediminis]
MAKKKIDFDFDLGLNLDFDLDLGIDKDFDFQEKFTELCMKKIQKKKQKNDKEKDIDKPKCSKDKKDINKRFKKTAKDLISLKPIELKDLFDNKKEECLKKPNKLEPSKDPECSKKEHAKDLKYLKKLKPLKDLDKLDDLDDLKHLKKLKHLKSKKDCICEVIKKFEGKRVSIRTKSGEGITGTIAKVKKNNCVVIDQRAMVSPPEPALRTIINCKDIESISKFV